MDFNTIKQCTLEKTLHMYTFRSCVGREFPEFEVGRDKCEKPFNKQTQTFFSENTQLCGKGSNRSQQCMHPVVCICWNCEKILIQTAFRSFEKRAGRTLLLS